MEEAGVNCDRAERIATTCSFGVLFCMMKIECYDWGGRKGPHHGRYNWYVYGPQPCAISLD